MGQGQRGTLGWFEDSREADVVRDLLANWEFKPVVVYWNPLIQAWEVNGVKGQRFEDKGAAIASQRRDGWELCEVMEDSLVALPEKVEAAYESRAEAAAFTVFLQRRRH